MYLHVGIVIPGHRVPQLGDQALYVKSKSLYSCSSSNSGSPGVQSMGVKEEARAQLGWGFYNTRGWVKGFLQFRTPDWLTFV